MSDLPPAFLDLLESERDALNARYSLRVRGGAKIDPAAFLAHVRESVAPLVAKVHATLPERARGVLLALYDASLDLFAASLLGPEARVLQLRRVWSDLFPQTVNLLARAPQQVAGSLCNAMFQIASQPGTRPEFWLTRMGEVEPHCHSVPHLLAAGKVVAWQSGMVQFRSAALDAAAQLPAHLGSEAFGLRQPLASERMSDLLLRLQNDPWLTIDAALQGESQPASLKCVATVGAFSGFGGVFRRPPVVTCRVERLFVSDGCDHWQLFADAYGAWFRRMGSPEMIDLTPAEAVTIDRRGTIAWEDLSLEQPHLAQPTSFACDGATLAVTIPTSHHLFLYSRTGGTA